MTALADLENTAIAAHTPTSCRNEPMLSEQPYPGAPEFIECDKITGDDPSLARLVVNSIEQADDVLEALFENAVTSAAVFKGTSVKRRLPPL